MRDHEIIVDSINILGKYLAKRDILELNQNCLQESYGFRQADLLILFGGSIPYGCDVAARGFLNGIAKNMMIAGGAGHTTDFLRRAVHDKYPDIATEGRMEADIMADYLKCKYGIENLYLERHSTNCGNNVSYALDEVRKNELPHESVIVIQDSTLQMRMDATFKKTWKDEHTTLVHYAPYIVEVVEKDGSIQYQEPIPWGMWSMEQYITLLLGEIPRLRDDENGYGPKGQNYLIHMDVPTEVVNAFEILRGKYADSVRVANPKFKS